MITGSRSPTRDTAKSSIPEQLRRRCGSSVSLAVQATNRRRIWSCSLASRLASMSCSTPRTAALAIVARGARARSAQSAGRSSGSCAGRTTSPWRSRACRSTFIDCRVTKAPRASSGSTARSLGKQLQAVVVHRHAQRPRPGLQGRVQALAATFSMYPSDLSGSIPARLDSCRLLTYIVVFQKLTYHAEARIWPSPDPFISLQVRDLERSAAFYERYLGLKRSNAGPPHAVVFDTKPIAFAVRNIVADADLDAIAQPGQGIALWLHAPDAQNIHDALATAGTTMISAPADGPFGRLSRSRPRRLPVTLHDRGSSRASGLQRGRHPEQACAAAGWPPGTRQSRSCSLKQLQRPLQVAACRR